MGLINYLNNKVDIKKLRKQALIIDSYKDTIAKLSDEELKEKTLYFKKQFENVKDLDEEKAVLESITNEAFAVCREAAKRVLNQFPYLVQIMGALVIHHGDIAEMKTGEGKTLTATMAVYTNALTGKGVHVITVNEYLAARDSEWMGGIYRFLGLSVGCNLAKLHAPEKKEQYACDITYSTDSELGFDYLRDNMVKNYEDKVISKGLNFCIIDEVDSILIDDARTPLIISGGNTENFKYYLPCQSLVAGFKKNLDYELDEESKAVTLLDSGIQKAEKAFNLENLYSLENQTILHCVNNALKANYSMKLDVDYVVRNDKVEIVDQNTGRILDGRTFNDGLHQAIEAKEGVRIKPENMTYATITYQNFFRLYNKLSGMTGTAKTDEIELLETFNMQVIQVPTNKPVVRKDYEDAIYGNKKAKYNAIINEVEQRHSKGQPVLVGTISVATSEHLYKLMLQRGLNAELLNAKNDAREADIVALAGQKGAITIATNMAGRGTDIKLGEGVKELGGLCVIGSERHDSKRIDNQLRGRSGRQGDVGCSRFYVSLEDDLLKKNRRNVFSKRLISKAEKLDKLSLAYMVNRTQNRIETINYSSRKHLLDYDNVLSNQRETIYRLRNQILLSENLNGILDIYVNNIIDNIIKTCVVTRDLNGEESIRRINKYINNNFLLDVKFEDTGFNEFDNKKAYKNALKKLFDNLINDKKEELTEEVYNRILKMILLSTIDRNWTIQITKMDHLKDGVYYRQYANTDPLALYKTEGLAAFYETMFKVSKDAIMYLFKIKVQIEKPAEPVNEQASQEQKEEPASDSSSNNSN